MSQDIDNRRTSWIVELDGRPIALLESPAFVDMYWERFIVVPVPQSGVDVFAMADVWTGGRPTFIRRDSGEKRSNVLLSPGTPTAQDPTIVARGLATPSERTSLGRRVLRRLRGVLGR